jgi:hypothetical protein
MSRLRESLTPKHRHVVRDEAEILGMEYVSFDAFVGK